MSRAPRVAVLLAGCGHLDGAEIREAVLTLLALDQHGAEVQCLALDGPQHHVVDHRTGQVAEGETRNILSEAARIARGKVIPLAGASASDYDALLMPGGYGVAKNHCGFAFKGPEADVHPQVAAFIRGFFDAGKPVGAICIAPALVALVAAQAGEHPSLTIGDDPGCAAALGKLGARHQDRGSAREIVVDEAMKLVTTPAYMFDDARLSDVLVGIDRTVAEVLKRVSVAV
ncbi:MAG TPA: isoprenoid biosynthesis glyoxalase ElbB [Holophagaceae bacterium]|nr:isoprenoid biosynthesis glyoxalase ElbB [Holophagaceae bacterium]